MPTRREQHEAIEEYVRVIRYCDDAFGECLSSLAETMQRGYDGDGGLLIPGNLLRADGPSPDLGMIILTPGAFAGIQDAERAEETGPLRTATIVYTADEAVKALAEGATGDETFGCGPVIAGHHLSDHIRATANSHRHHRTWAKLVREGRGHELDGKWNQNVLRAMLGQTQPVTKPCGLELVALLCDTDILADVVTLNVDTLMANLYAIAEDVAARVLGRPGLVRRIVARLDDQAGYVEAPVPHVPTR